MEEKIGDVTHYYSGAGVGIVKLTAPLAVGDRVHIVGATTDFDQLVESMQVDRKSVESAKKGAEVGVKVSSKVREGDAVFLVRG